MLKEFYGTSVVSVRQIAELNAAILRNYASLWDIPADVSAGAFDAVNLFRALSCMYLRYNEIRATGEDIRGLVLRLQGGGAQKDEAGKGLSTTKKKVLDPTDPMAYQNKIEGKGKTPSIAQVNIVKPDYDLYPVNESMVSYPFRQLQFALPTKALLQATHSFTGL